MLSPIQALTIDESLDKFEEKIYEANLETLVSPPSLQPFEQVKVLESPQARSTAISSAANYLADMRSYGFIRIQAKTSTFSLPNVDLNDPLWDAREGTRENSYRELQLEERRALERHARVMGCRLGYSRLKDRPQKG
jgi:hypothetical protein